ncbi:MAG: hypothetical protein WCV67_05090 [Victivallaceae bacterium]|jgi:hypothetical protein
MKTERRYAQPLSNYSESGVQNVVCVVSSVSDDNIPEFPGFPELPDYESALCGAGVQNVRERCPECTETVSKICWRGVQNVYSIPLFQLFPDHGKNRGEQVSSIIFLKKCFFLETGLAIFFAI